MTATCVQIGFSLRCSAEHYHTIAEGAVSRIAGVPGLLAKWWWLDPEANAAGGVYKFETRKDAEGYVSGPIVTALRAAPFCANVQAKIVDLLEEPTRSTDIALQAARDAQASSPASDAERFAGRV